METFRQVCRDGSRFQNEIVLTAGREWGDWASGRSAWRESVEAYGYALQALDELLLIQVAREEKESWLKVSQELMSRAAYAQARADDLPGAVMTAERGRARLLAGAFEETRRDLSRLADIGRSDLLGRFRESCSRLGELARHSDVSGIPGSSLPPLPSGTLSIAIEAARKERNDAIAEIRMLPGYSDFFVSWSIERIQQAVGPGTALAYLIATPAGGLALAVHAAGPAGGPSRRDSITRIWLDQLSIRNLNEILSGLPKTEGGYLGAYDTWRRNADDDSARESWFAALDHATRWLWDAAVGPLVAELAPPRPAPPARLMPYRRGRRRPRHRSSASPSYPPACWASCPSTRPGPTILASPTGGSMPSPGSTSASPRALALAASRERAQTANADAILVVDNPDGSLRFSGHESDAVLSYFPEPARKLLRGDLATREEVLRELPAFPVLHFSTHAWAGWDSPMESGLLLAGDARLTVSDILSANLRRARLAVLSACETGIPGTELPDELVGLPGGLVQAGVAGVIASLWPVDDRSTAMLMEQFFRFWISEKMEPAAALGAAQAWLRDTTNYQKGEYFRSSIPELTRTRMPASVALDFYGVVMTRQPDTSDFRHPFWWAAFTLTGI